MQKIEKEIEKEIDESINIIIKNTFKNLEIFKKNLKEQGRGCYLLYTKNIKSGRDITEYDYRTKKEALDVFLGNEYSQKELGEIIDSYNKKEEIVFILITDFNNATQFVKLNIKKIITNKN